MYDKIIIDGNNFLYRAYYVSMKNAPQMVQEMNTAPLYQFFYMLKTLKENYPADKVYITWDKRINSDGSNFRKELIAYKAHREENEITRTIWQLCDILSEALLDFGITTILPLNLEADDVIGFIAGKEGSSLIVSSDKDMLQLVDEKTHVLQRNHVLVTLNNFEELVGVPKDYFIIYKAILGDDSDNIEGLPKYGPVRSGKLAAVIHQKGITAEQLLYENVSLPEITTEQKNQLITNLKLSHLPFARKYADEFESYENQWERSLAVFNKEHVRELFEKYRFFTFSREFGRWNTLFNNSSKTETMDLSNILDLISL